MKIYIKSCFVGILVFFFVIVGSIQSVYATATLELFDGITTKTIADGSMVFGLMDIDPRAGIVMWSGNIGVFDFEVAVGSTKPYMSGISEIDLFDISSNSSGAGTLEVWFSETDFGGVGSSSAAIQTTVGGTTDDTVEFFSYIDNSNILFGQGTQTAHLGSYVDIYDPEFDPPLGFSGTVNANVPVASLYSITALAKVTHERAGDLSSYDLSVKVVAPEPVSSVLFVIGGAVMGFRRLRKG